MLEFRLELVIRHGQVNTTTGTVNVDGQTVPQFGRVTQIVNPRNSDWEFVICSRFETRPWPKLFDCPNVTEYRNAGGVKRGALPE